jgi:hypothetical protein
VAETEAQDRVLRLEAESTTTLASTREEVEGLVQRIALHKGELAEAHQAWEMAKEDSRGLSDAAADAKWGQEKFEGEFRE